MAMSRTTRLVLLGTAAVALVALLSLSLRDPRTIVVSPDGPTQLQDTPQGISPTALGDQLQGEVVGDLAHPRFTGRTPTGGTWELTAERASLRRKPPPTP